MRTPYVRSTPQNLATVGGSGGIISALAGSALLAAVREDDNKPVPIALDRADVDEL
jgi:hypothetical protein